MKEVHENLAKQRSDVHCWCDRPAACPMLHQGERHLSVASSDPKGLGSRTEKDQEDKGENEARRDRMTGRRATDKAKAETEVKEGVRDEVKEQRG